MKRFVILTLLGSSVPGFAQVPVPVSQAMPFEMAKPGLDIAVIVSDLAKSQAFYGGVLGLKPVPSATLPLAGGGVMVRYAAGGATEIKLRTFDKVPPAVELGTMSVNGMRLLTLFVKDADALAKRIVAAGLPAPSFTAPEKAPYKYAFVADPDGNQIEILTFKTEGPAEQYERFQIGITVSDAEKTRDFYAKILGLKERPPQPLSISPGALEYFTSVGGTTIKFWSPKGDRPTRTGAIGAALGIRYMTFLVKDVDATHEALKARGVKITAPPRDLTPTVRIMMVADPDGNTIEFATRK